MVVCGVKPRRGRFTKGGGVGVEVGDVRGIIRMGMDIMDMVIIIIMGGTDIGRGRGGGSLLGRWCRRLYRLWWCGMRLGEGGAGVGGIMGRGMSIGRVGGVGVGVGIEGEVGRCGWDGR